MFARMVKILQLSYGGSPPGLLRFTRNDGKPEMLREPQHDKPPPPSPNIAGVIRCVNYKALSNHPHRGVRLASPLKGEEAIG